MDAMSGGCTCPSPFAAPRCCHAHDCCYQKVFDQGCRPYVDHYDYTIENGTEIVCSEYLPGRLAGHRQGRDWQPCHPVRTQGAVPIRLQVHIACCFKYQQVPAMARDTHILNTNC